MRFAYPATFEPEAGGYVVSFRDVPGANTEGDDEAEALAEAQDALVVALGHYVERRLPLPAPSRPRPGERLVAVPSLVAAKLAL
jgi:antitoxin HicB